MRILTIQWSLLIQVSVYGGVCIEESKIGWCVGLHYWKQSTWLGPFPVASVSIICLNYTSVLPPSRHHLHIGCHAAKRARNVDVTMHYVHIALNVHLNWWLHNNKLLLNSVHTDRVDVRRGQTCQNLHRSFCTEQKSNLIDKSGG